MSNMNSSIDIEAAIELCVASNSHEVNSNSIKCSWLASYGIRKISYRSRSRATIRLVEIHEFDVCAMATSRCAQ